MKDFIEQLYQDFQEELAVYQDLGGMPVKRLSGVLFATSEVLKKLKTEVLEHPFVNKADEVCFFKYDKPKFFCEKLYALEIFTIETNRPLTDQSALKAFYEKELGLVNRFFLGHQFLYQYFKLGISELDQVLFLRGVKPADILVPGSPELNPEFSTAADFMFSKFMAYEKLQSYLVEQLTDPVEQPPGPAKNKKIRPLKWTGNKADLVELAYGIYDSMQINDGDVDIADIVVWLEQSLQINLGRYYQTFMEVKARKSVSRTRLTDHMRAMLLLHMDEGDAFKPKKPTKVSGSRSGD